jgi:hypothetical protein
LSSVESQFLESEDLSAYEGEWIAILDRKVIAHAKTIEVFDSVAMQALTRTPLYHRIPKREEDETFIL